MRYSGRANWGLSIFILILLAVAFSIESSLELLFSLVIAFIFTLVLLLTTRKSVTIEDSKLIYDAYIFRWNTIHIELSASDIRYIKFDLKGWLGKNAKVKGENITSHYYFINFEPTDFYEELVQFAVKNNIPFEQTKDFQTGAKK